MGVGIMHNHPTHQCWEDSGNAGTPLWVCSYFFGLVRAAVVISKHKLYNLAKKKEHTAKYAVIGVIRIIP